MNKKMWVLTALLLTGICLAACAAPVPAPGDSVKGRTATIVLEENPTTGYTWAVNVDNPSVISLKEDKYFSKAEKNLVGVGGVHQYVFEAGSPGSAVITFDLGQQWDGGEKGNQIKRYNVTVNEDGTIASLEAV